MGGILTLLILALGDLSVAPPRVSSFLCKFPLQLLLLFVYRENVTLLFSQRGVVYTVYFMPTLLSFTLLFHFLKIIIVDSSMSNVGLSGTLSPNIGNLSHLTSL